MTQQRARQRRKSASCFVHALLEHKGRDSQWAPSNEAAQQGRQADKGTESPPNVDHNTQSRLLTKKQLSDMAFGIRELSKKLGHIRLNLKVRNVFLLTKAHDQTLIAKTKEMAQWLLDNKNSQGDPYIV